MSENTKVEGEVVNGIVSVAGAINDNSRHWPYGQPGHETPDFYSWKQEYDFPAADRVKLSPKAKYRRTGGGKKASIKK